MIIAMLAIVAAAETVDPADAFFAEFAEKRGHIHQLEAQFAQDNFVPGDRYRATGRLFYARPRRIMFQYSDPPVTYFVDGMIVYEYDEETAQMRILDLSEEPEAEALFLGFQNNVERLRTAYDAVLFDPDQIDEKELAMMDRDAFDGEFRGLELCPKPGKPSEGEEAEDTVPLFERVRLFLRVKDLLPVYIHVVNDEDSEMVLHITQFKINDAADLGDMYIDLPEGTKVIQDDKLLQQVGPEGKRVPAPEAREEGSESP